MFAVIVGDRRDQVRAAVRKRDVLVVQIDRGRLVAARIERDLRAVGQRAGVAARPSSSTSVENSPAGSV